MGYADQVFDKVYKVDALILRNLAHLGEPEDAGTEALIEYYNVRVPATAMLGEEGNAFGVAQVRLGGGRVHHAMRTVGNPKHPCLLGRGSCMRFMYQYPDLTGLDGDMLDSGPVGKLARAAEDAGWDGFAFTEHPAPGLRWLQTGGHQTLDPFVALSYVAAVTTRLRLLTYLSVLPYRNPMLLAKAAASVDILSGGRFILGAGAGYNKSEFHALGVDFDERNTLFDEALDVLPLHWSGEPFSYKGQHFSAREVIARPRPPQQPIPIWIGGNSKLTLRRVAQRANGWMPMLGPESLFSTARTAAISSSSELAAAIGQLRDSAGDRGAGLDVAVPYTDPSVHDAGTDWDKHRDAVASLAEAGATWVIVPGRSGTRDESVAFLERFGEQVARQ